MLSPFEQQVAAALAEAAGVDSRYDHEMRVIEFLAPRVAAAIDADRFGEADEIARQRGAALAALRREP